LSKFLALFFVFRFLALGENKIKKEHQEVSELLVEFYFTRQTERSTQPTTRAVPPHLSQNTRNEK
jgi:hypothetical protein